MCSKRQRFAPFTAKQYPVVRAHHTVFIQSSAAGVLGCLQLLAAVTNAAGSSHIQVFARTEVFIPLE